MFINKFVFSSVYIFVFLLSRNSYSNPYALAVKEVAKASQTKEGQKAWGMANDTTKPMADAVSNSQKNILSGKAFEEESGSQRMISGAAMGAGGIGLSKYMSAKSEESADKEAEEDMKSYLETFRCKVSDKQYKGGEKNISTDGGNALIENYQEFKTLSAQLKEKKELLEMSAGIESEVVLDKANIGLYDDVNIGKTTGHYASVSKALTDPDSEDAKKWNEEKDKTKNTKIAGGVAAVAGIGGGLVGNMILERKAGNNAKSDGSNDSSSGGVLENIKSGVLDKAKGVISENSKSDGSNDSSSGGMLDNLKGGILDKAKGVISEKAGGLINNNSGSEAGQGSGVLDGIKGKIGGLVNNQGK